MTNLKRTISALFAVLVLVFSCSPRNEKVESDRADSDTVGVYITDDYELHQVTNSKATLILYPGAGTNSEWTKKEFDILPKARENKVSVLLMNFTNHLWITERDCEDLMSDLENIFKKHNLFKDKIYIGGMSVGGTVALSLSDYLIRTSSHLTPEGVFIVDSPIDLYALYQSAETDILREDFSEERLAEPRFIINYFQNELGTDDSLKANISKVSPFVYSQQSIGVSALKDTKLRFYTEPDSLWWRENRDTDYNHTNAYVIQQITGQLKSTGWDKVELLETKGKGYRSNGDRHPHSWSIVDGDNLIDWMTQ